MALFVPVKDLLFCSKGFFINFLRATVIFGVGWLIAKLIKEAISIAVPLKYFLNYIFCSRPERLKKPKSAVKHFILEIIGIVLYWIIILGALILSLNCLL